MSPISIVFFANFDCLFFPLIDIVHIVTVSIVQYKYVSKLHVLFLCLCLQKLLSDVEAHEPYMMSTMDKGHYAVQEAKVSSGQRTI